MAILISAIVKAAERSPFVHLEGVRFCLNENFRVIYHSGNNTVVFKVEHEGRMKSLRCYRRGRRYLDKIYKENYYPKEFRYRDDYHEMLLDVVLCDWIEGDTLQYSFEKAMALEDGCAERVMQLSKMFDLLAESIVDKPWAHGDISADNIIVTPEGEMKLIDFDSKYIDELSQADRDEVGTTAYQLRQISKDRYNYRMDDYSLALISVSLRAVAESPSLWREVGSRDAILLDATRIAKKDTRAVTQSIEVLAQGGCFAHHYLAQATNRYNNRIDNMPQILAFERGRILAIHTSPAPELELFIDRWGKRGYYNIDSGELHIPPMFDTAEEFEDDVAWVSIDDYYYLIDCDGYIIERAQ